MGSSLWSETTEFPKYRTLEHAASAEVTVVGGGIAGLTAALSLQIAGKNVVLLEARHLGDGETGKTTAHLTELLDTRAFVLESRFGCGGALMAAEASRTAIATIEQLAHECAPACHFKRVPAYLYAETEEQADELRRELESLARAGTQASWVESLPLPFPTRGGIRVERQAQFHPLEYIKGLAAQFLRAGGRIYEGSEVLSVNDGEPCRVTLTGERTIVAHDVFVLTDVPVINRAALRTTNAAYRSYAIAAKITGDFPEGLFSDAYEPYHYTRLHQSERGTFLIIGGEDHETTQHNEPARAFANLEEYAATKFGLRDIAYRWSGQIIVPADGLPFIGKSPGEQHVYVATGFAGTGITFGTVAGMLLSDLVRGVPNSWVELFSPNRVRPLTQESPATITRDRFSRGDVDAVREVPAGEGRLLRSGGKMVAVFRSQSGRVSACSAVCTHMGCYVRWNSSESSWDCPCHGSRFTPEGNVLNGPATRALEAVPIRDDE